MLPHQEKNRQLKESLRKEYAPSSHIEERTLLKKSFKETTMIIKLRQHVCFKGDSNLISM